MLNHEIYEQLEAEFPEEALSKDSSRGFDLTSIKPQYIKERLNTVFGLDGWRFEGKFEEKDAGVLFFGELSIYIPDGRTEGVGFMGDNPVVSHWHKVEGVGFAGNKKNLGDTYKGAMTDALSKSASTLGIGNSVFKGKVAPPGKGGKKEWANKSDNAGMF